MLQYLIKLSISLAVLFIFYRFVLRPLTFYQCNRFYLLCYSLLSFIIPAINVGPLVSDARPDSYISLLPPLVTYDANADSAGSSWFFADYGAGEWLLFVFTIGVVCMLFRLAWQYRSLQQIRRSAVLVDRQQGIRLYRTASAAAPFSFGNAVYFNNHLHSPEELQRIIQHEFVHVRQKHTIDLLVAEMLCVLNWYNPFAWLIRNSIRQNLEFIADNNVVESGLDKKQYQYLLLKAVGGPQYSMVNHFNLSSLKKRIIMMNKMKSTRLHLARFVFLLPLLTVLLLAFRSRQTPPPPPAPLVMTDNQEAGTPPAARARVPVAVEHAQIYADTVPQRTVRDRTNSKGFIVSLADNEGESVVLVRDKEGHIVKALPLTEWNNRKGEMEKMYGKLLPPLPPPPAPGLYVPVPDRPVQSADAAPVVPPVPSVHAVPPAPARPALPAGVRSIHIDHAVGTHPNTVNSIAIVQLTNGRKETYHLNNAAEAAEYNSRYGPIPAVAPVQARPGEPVNVQVAPSAPVKVKAQPLIIIDSVEQRPGTSLKSIDPDRIENVNVLKDNYATSKYGERGNNGVVEISLKKDTAQLWKNALLVIDGKEMPPGTRLEDVIKPEHIARMNVLKGSYAFIQYGQKGKNGVVEVVSK